MEKKDEGRVQSQIRGLMKAVLCYTFNHN